MSPHYFDQMSQRSDGGPETSSADAILAIYEIWNLLSKKVLRLSKGAINQPRCKHQKITPSLTTCRVRLMLLMGLLVQGHLTGWGYLYKKHRKNCKCCHHHSLFNGHNVNVNIVVLNCQKCNQCHKSLGLIFEGVVMSWPLSLSFQKIRMVQKKSENQNF